MFLAAKNSLHRQITVRRRIVTVKQPVLVPPSFRTFSADLLPQTLQNLQVVMLVHRLAWRKKFLVNNALTVKKITNMLLMFDLTCPTLFGRGEFVSSHGVVTESRFEHFVRFRCSFPESEVKFHANALFFQISHFTYNRKSRIALNTHNNKRSLRSNTKGYGDKTH
jgi:hypothetical protein